jgi:hypothetical protein
MKAIKSNSQKSAKRTTHSHLSNTSSKFLTDKHYNKSAISKIMRSKQDLLNKIAKDKQSGKFKYFGALKAPKI